MELRDIYDVNGRSTGKVIEKGAPLSEGEYLYHVHIIMKNVDGMYVLQQRSLKARHSPGKWDVTGGGVMHGETGAQAASREAREELCIVIDPADEVFIGRQVEHLSDGKYGLITDVFAARVNTVPSDWVLSRYEVEAARLAPFAEFVAAAMHNKNARYRSMLEEIDRLL